MARKNRANRSVTKYTNEEIIANSEFAQEFMGLIPFKPDSNGRYNSDKFFEAGPIMIPCRRILAEIAILSFDKPEDLAIIEDDTVAGKQIGTKCIVHKKHKEWVVRRIELVKEVFAENGYSIGDPNDDKFIPMQKMQAMQLEAHMRQMKESE